VAQSSTIKHFAYDLRLPKTFFVYPPATSATPVDIEYSTTPPEVAAVGNAINLDDIYATALKHYVLAIAYAKDNSVQAGVARSQMHMAYFESLLAGKTAADVGMDQSSQQAKGS
jgi:hypothetical protein